jgi:ATP/maltotriose-dependent transcriptional regulator MalT
LWFAAEDDVAEALHHALLAADRELASDIIDDHPKADTLIGLLRRWFADVDGTATTQDSNGRDSTGRDSTDDTDEMDTLLEQAFSQGISREQHNQLLATIEQNRPIHTRTTFETLNLETLSERENDVLLLIAAGYSNKAIAKRLNISLNTVKTHTKNINSKLNVSSRGQAAARARDLGLID